MKAWAECRTESAGRQWPSGARSVHSPVLCQDESSDLRPHLEANLDQVAEPAIDVHSAARGQVKGTSGVPLVLHRHEWRRQERRFALSAMGMAGQYPPFEPTPGRIVGAVRIVAERQRRTLSVVAGQGLARTEAPGPQSSTPTN